MIYTCCKCLFEYEQKEGEHRCPDCGSMDVRPANAIEIAEYWQHKEEFDREWSA